MSPNPFGLLKLAVRPDKWMQRKHSSNKSPRRQEHWSLPFPGTYEHIPGRGWYLVAFDADVDEAALPPAIYEQKPARLPCAVTYSQLMRRYMFATEYNERRMVENSRTAGGKGEMTSQGFFRLDDGVTWVQCWDSAGVFFEGPYFRYYLHEPTRSMRRLVPEVSPSHTKRVDRQSRRDRWERSQSSATTSTIATNASSNITAFSSSNASAPCSPCQSRMGSFSDDAHRRLSAGILGGSDATISSALFTPVAVSRPSPTAMPMLQSCT